MHSQEGTFDGLVFASVEAPASSEAIEGPIKWTNEEEFLMAHSFAKNKITARSTAKKQ